MLRTFVVRNRDGHEPTQGIVSSVLGLALTRAIEPHGPSRGWTITHLSSGLSLGVFFENAMHAGRFAHLLRGTDWRGVPAPAHADALANALCICAAQDQSGEPWSPGLVTLTAEAHEYIVEVAERQSMMHEICFADPFMSIWKPSTRQAT